MRHCSKLVTSSWLTSWTGIEAKNQGTIKRNRQASGTAQAETVKIGLPAARNESGRRSKTKTE
jgi:hypothetical protein